jgi:hypothetical protein
MKKPTSPGDTRDTRPMVVTLKVWRKSSLAREDYDFSVFADWPKHALNVAWLWELEREMGSTRGPFYAAWQIHELKRILAKLKSDELYFDDLAELLPVNFAKTSEQRAKVWAKAIESLEGEIKRHEKAYFEDRRGIGKSPWLTKGPLPPRPMLHSHSLAQVAACFEQQQKFRPGKEKEVSLDFNLCGRLGGAYTRIHALEIDWTKTESELMDAFKNWLRDGEHQFSPDQQLDSRHRKGKRETAGLVSYLRDLAIYRISEAGFTHKAGLEMLGLKMSAQNWEHAQARTKEKIRGRIARLCQCAKLEAVGGGKEAYWKDLFIGFDALDDPTCV